MQLNINLLQINSLKIQPPNEQVSGHHQIPYPRSWTACHSQFTIEQEVGDAHHPNDRKGFSSCGTFLIHCLCWAEIHRHALERQAEERFLNLNSVVQLRSFWIGFTELLLSELVQETYFESVMQS